MSLSYRAKLLLSITILSVGMTTGSAWFFYTMIYDTIWQQTANRLKDIGRTGAFLITDEHRQIIQKLDQETEKRKLARSKESLAAIAEGDTGDGLSAADIDALQKSAEFQNLIQALRKIKFGTRKKIYPIGHLPQKPVDMQDRPLVRYTYILVPIPESPDKSILKFIADADYQAIDINNNNQIDDDETPTEIGLLYNVVDQPRMLEALNEGTVTASDEYFEDVWGIWFSAYVPILDPSGKPIAVMGLDLGAQSEYNQVKRLRSILIGIIIGSLALSLIVSYFLAMLLARPIAKLREGAERVQKRDFDTRIEIDSKDDIGVMAKTFNDMVKEIKEYAGGLEDMVSKRTAELEQTLKQVQELKNQQDADYYLTTLLANPLFRNRSKSQLVQIRFLMEHKKKFKFKKWEGEIGGDLCVSGNLNFSGERYVFFINGDAMGKSMQGAGGALVMGAILNSIMARSAADNNVLAITPQLWLEQMFMELQRVFEAFDGTMFVSCVAGLIRESDGHLLYFNAEHPFTVLFRNNKASFLEEDFGLAKIGVPFQNVFAIQEYQLQTGDVLISGSDGRDDLVLSANDGERVINEDENLFLHIVEESDGDLVRIQSLLKQSGEISDDLSLIRIEFSPVVQNDGQVDPLEHTIQLIKQKKYRDALALLKQPDFDNYVLANYYRGLCQARLGNSDEALVYLNKAESLMGEHFAVLNLLGRIYLELGNKSEAKMYLDRALVLDPDNASIHRIKEKAGLS